MSDIPIKPVSGPLSREVQEPKPNEGAGFASTLEEALKEVNALQNQSTEEIGRALQGDLTDVHSAMLALQKADLSFQLMLQVRNKLVQAYRDIMRM